MKLALDPYMLRTVPLTDLPGLVAGLGQGEVDWDEFFGTLDRLDFDGIMTVCVFAWEERARESCVFNREQIAKYRGG